MSTPDNRNRTYGWKNYWRVITPAALAGLIVACSGGAGGSLAGIGGSGFISSGSISSFGSIFVNGVEFNTDSATFDVEDASGSQQDLSVGMVVQISGSINPDGLTGTATSVRYGDQLEGPVESPVTQNADATEKTFDVLGTTVIVDSTNTVFKGTGFSFDTIELNDGVEVSGHYDQIGTLRATYIELKAADFDLASTVEIEGDISSLSGTRFNIRNVIIDASAANLSDLSNGLQNGVYVEVKGIYDPDTLSITATEVEAEDIELSDSADEVSIEGYITRYASDSDFDINGITVDASAAAFEPTTLVLSLGIKVEAEGAITNGVLNATDIESRDSSAKISAAITSIDTVAGNMTLSVASTVVNVVVTSSTSIEDDRDDLETFNFSNLTSNDFVEIVGFETDTDTITATKIQRSEPADFALQGFAMTATGSAASGGTITVLGATFNFNTDTEFSNTDENLMTAGDINDLLSGIASAPVLVNIEHMEGSDIAVKIDLE
ncbi:hypothetical protein MNBD_GAMMA11-1458 [hydrothermal vent metagenome]|uniref:DUF5666 domain-containing protein n=1 Tax=hydrothermal vent metagenome TaxID=652676 RepID=A0A3B0X4X8_9ZZZZ